MKLDDEKIIRTKPLTYIGGVLVRDDAHAKRLLLEWQILGVAGGISFFIFIALLSYRIQLHLHWL